MTMNKKITGIYLFVLLVVLMLSAPREAFAQKDLKDSITDGALLLAVEKYDAGAYDAAERMLRSIVGSDPGYDAAHYYLALVYLAKDENDLAEAELLRAVEADPGNFWYRQRLAVVYRYTNQLPKAIELYEKLLADFPKKSELYFDLVEMYAQNAQIDKALATLDDVERIFGQTESIAIYRFRLLMASGKTEEAYSSLEEYNSKYSSPYVLSTLGDYRMSMYEDSLAVAYYDEALSLDDSFAPAILGKAEARRMTRKYSEFFPLLDSYMSSETVPAQGKSEYLKALVEQSDPKFVSSFLPQLDTAANICFRKHPSDSSVIATVASYYYRTQRQNVAEDLFRLNASMHPDKPELTATYLYALLYSKNWEKLAEAGSEAALKYPDIPDFMALAGTGYSFMKEYDKVIELSQEMLRTAPKDSAVVVSAYSAMGDAYYQKNDTKNAFKAYDKVLKASPDNIYVLNNYAYYLSVTGRNLKKAYAMSKKTIEAEPDNATYLDTFGWILYLQGKPLEAKPFFKHAMLYGGKDSPVIMDHYAEVLYALKEYDLAFVYWYRAQAKNGGEIPDLDARIAERKKAAGK